MTSFIDRLLGREPIKAASGPGVFALQTDQPLYALTNNPQERMARYLAAYKVGWFYKAESKISRDLAGLSIHVAPENTEGENEAEVIEPDLYTPWERLDPIGQFLRLMERPNPYQTGRQLRQKTQIRIDMAGAAFWYLERPDLLYGLPQGIYGISPARMWPSMRDGRLIGWVMDRDKPGGGVPFEASEILPFMTGSAEDEVWGVGVVEAVYAQVPLTTLTATHIADVLRTGGRLAGMAWPKNRALDEAEFQDAQRAWRSVVSDSNAAKRLLLFPEPMEYAPGASTPAEIGIPELATLNRDEILTAFPISPYQLGVPMPGGLNSGETRKQDRRDYWEGTIHPRTELFEEVVQTGLLSRYEKAVGSTYDFEIEEPGLDDAAALIEKGGALRVLVNLGFDEKEAVKAVALDHIKFNGIPKTPSEGLAVTVNDSTRMDASATVQKLVTDKPTKADEMQARREGMTAGIVREGRDKLTTFLADQQERTLRRIRGVWPAGKAARMKIETNEWWDGASEDAALRSVVRGMYLEVGRAGLTVVADQVGRMVTPYMIDPVLLDLLAYGGDRITDINDRTRDALQAELTEGTRRGYSINQLIDGVSSEGFKGLQNVLLDNGVAAFGDARAEMIARTETALSWNRAALSGYKEFNVRQVIAIDGDTDADCANRNGGTFSIDEAYGIADHPNGTLDWIPVVPVGKSAEPDRMLELIAAMKSVPVQAQIVLPTSVDIPAPVVNFTPPDVFVDAPVVHVAAADMTGVEAVVSRLMERPLTRTVYDRDPVTHKITGHHEEPVHAN